MTKANIVKDDNGFSGMFDHNETSDELQIRSSTLTYLDIKEPKDVTIIILFVE